MVKLLEQVRGANEHYRALFFNSAKDAIALLSPDGIVLDANDRWGELLDVPAASLVGMHVRDFAPTGHETANTDRYLQSVNKVALPRT